MRPSPTLFDRSAAADCWPDASVAAEVFSRNGGEIPRIIVTDSPITDDLLKLRP
jgi:hypothetical protein